ncbi:MAG: M24 family metallopeptidase [Pseudomonadota bacterium]
MPSDSLIQAHRTVQNAAKSALANLVTKISTVDTEESIAAAAYKELCALGFPDTWYYTCPAFVLAGSRSCQSISGREYVPGKEPIGAFNLVTVDVSPVQDGHWGDCARSFYVENGRVTSTAVTPELAIGQRFLKALHADMQQTVRPDMTFHELFEWTNQYIAANGFENLDFLGNVGHSIATRREDRQYIETHNDLPLCKVPFFTFEPHVREVGGCWGFKHENIFFFNAMGRLEEL